MESLGWFLASDVICSPSEYCCAYSCQGWPNELLACCHSVHDIGWKIEHVLYMKQPLHEKNDTKNLKNIFKTNLSCVCTLTPGPYHSVIFFLPTHGILSSPAAHSTASSVKTELTSECLIPWKWKVCEGYRCTCARLSPCAPVTPRFDSCGDVGDCTTSCASDTHKLWVCIFPESLRKKREKLAFRILFCCLYLTCT